MLKATPYLRILMHFAAVSFLLITSPTIHAEPPKPKLESFFGNPELAQVNLSPDGKFLGMLVATKHRVQLAVMDLNTKTPKIIAGFSNVDIAEFHWINNQRLVYSTEDNQTAEGENKFFPGLFAVNRDGTESRTLVERLYQPRFTTGTGIKKRILPANTFFLDVENTDTSDNIFVIQSEWDAVYDFKAFKLLKLNTMTGQVESYDRPGDTKQWLIDQTGVPRLNVTHQDGKSGVFYRDPTDEKWRKLAEFSSYTEQQFRPYDFGPDGSLYVISNTGRDTNALFKYDLKKNALDPQPLVSVNGYDFSGSLIFDHANKSLVGIHYQDDASGTLWLSEQMKQLQKTVDELLPTTINRLSFGSKGQNQHVLVKAYSDVHPASFFLYDVVSKNLISIGSTHPSIEPKQMSTQDMLRYKARDGLDIPAYLTLPVGANKKNLPMVVLVHGGPYMRGSSWGWDPQVQFLASRGYAVLQPEFRGSTGFGFQHFHAGWKQWGLAMQDDIADGAKWAIAQGIADPKRICIAGASYGGYATLMGLAKNPELFQCGINWVGVTDMNLMYESSWSNDASADWQQFGMPVLIGDKVKDAAQLKATSPIQIAEKITQPILLAYGRADRRVPIAHGTRFRDAVRAQNKNVEWIEYPEEGHGWSLVENRVDFWARVEKFLEKNIGKP